MLSGTIKMLLSETEIVITTLDYLQYCGARICTWYNFGKCQTGIFGESGAINEAFSDIIGKSFQYEMEPQKYEWTVGHELVATRFAKPLRSMEDPTLFSNPKMYKGKHWRDGGSVHSNSGVLNHWFYLLIEGGAGKMKLIRLTMLLQLHGKMCWI